MSADFAFIAVDGGGGALRVRGGQVGQAKAGSLTERTYPGATLGEVSLGEYYCDALTDFISASAVKPDRVVLAVGVLPGFPQAREDLLNLIKAATGAKEVWLTSDSVGAHCASIKGNGIVIAVGTGVAALATGRNRTYVHELSGDSYLIGDEGGAYWQGKSGLNSALRFKDGRGGSEALLKAALTYYKTTPDYLADLATEVDRPVHTIAGFAPSVSKLAADGDRHALAIIEKASEELALLATTALRICGDADFEAVITGGAIPKDGLLFHKTSELITAAGIPVRVSERSNLDGVTDFSQWDNPGVYSPIVQIL